MTRRDPVSNARSHAQGTQHPLPGELEVQNRRETQSRLHDLNNKPTRSRASPKRFVFKTSPRVKISGGVRQQQKKGSPRKAAPLPRQATKGRQQPGRRARKAPQHQQVVVHMAKAFEQSRRRRLILQEESEDDETAGEQPMHPTKPGALTGPTDDLRPKPQMDPLMPAKIATQLGSSPPRVCPHLRKKGGTDFSLPISQQDGGSALFGDLLDLEDKEIATLGGPIPEDHHHATESDDDQSTEDLHSFEIKRQSPVAIAIKTLQVMKGRVHQVVDVFEAGLVIAQEEVVSCKGSGSRLNEYGSNLMDPIMDNQKQVLEELDGDVGNPPIPKKHFVEASDSLDKVEEASLEWPPADK
ncbi:unnamed protein product [Linum trigynum]|uniref:Uncharacterized protein n=1 Tax=Linum trigynum TaxID=586398 RepID=A0AAV2CFZ0_9ROSI